MTTDTWAGSCVCHIIAGMSYLPNPEAVMIEFCRQQMFQGDSTQQMRNLMAKPGRMASPYALASHYIFTAGPEDKNSHAIYAKNYGSGFATLIRKNKLGKIMTIKKVLNTKYHPNTTCQAWLWQPDPQAIFNWLKIELHPVKPPVKE